MLIIDVRDAFWLVPSPGRKKICLREAGWQVLCLYAYGARVENSAAHLCCNSGRVQSVLAGPHPQRCAVEDGRLQVYVEDPLLILRGDQQRQRRLAVLAAAAWQIMGFALLFGWIGAASRPLLGSQSRSAMCSNVIAHKALRTLIRKGMAVETFRTRDVFAFTLAKSLLLAR